MTEKPVTEALVDMLRSRAEFGLKKYGTTLDRKDLSPAAWCQHAIEEALDEAGYLLALKRYIERINVAEIATVIDEMRGRAQTPSIQGWARRLEEAILGLSPRKD